MNWLAPISLVQAAGLAALACAVLVLLQSRVRGAQRLRVPFLAAWDDVAPAGAVRPGRRALAGSWSLVRVLLIATTLALALADPKPAWLAPRANATLVVLDGGAHMQARDVPAGRGRSRARFDRAREIAHEVVAQRVSSDDVLVAQLDSSVTPLCGFSRDAAQLAAAIDAARVSQAASRFSALLAFVRDWSKGRSHVDLILISDGAFEIALDALAQLKATGATLQQIRVGASAKNVGIRSFAVRAYAWDAERSEARVELENNDLTERAVELTLYADDRPIALEPVRLPPKSREVRVVSFASTGARFSVRVASSDGVADDQPFDDVAYAVLAQPAVRRVLLVSSGLPYLEDALALDPRLTVDRVAPSAYRGASGYALAIFDRFLPPTPPAVPTLWLAPEAGAGSPYRAIGSIERPFFEDVETDHAVLRSVSLRDVNLRRAQRVKLDPRDHVLAASRFGPLIVEGVRADQRFIALTFDVRESDLVLRTGWPILLSQIVQRLTAADSAADAPLRVGRTELRPVGADVATARLRTPKGDALDLAVHAGSVSLTLHDPGFYTLTAAGRTQLLAANADPDAGSRIAPRTVAPPPPRDARRGAAWLAPGTLAHLLLALAMVVFALDVTRAYDRRFGLALGVGLASTLLGAVALFGRDLTAPGPLAAWQLATPALLGLLGLLPFTFGRPVGLRRGVEASLRAACWACLVLALCRPERRPAEAPVGLVVAADVSASISDAALAEMQRQIAGLSAALAQRGRTRDARFHLVSVAARARVVDPEAPHGLQSERTVAGSTYLERATDLEAALHAAYALHDPARSPAVLLITDGNETVGDLAGESERAARLGVRIDYLVPHAGGVSDVAVRKLSLPNELAVGRPATLRAELSAERATRVHARLVAGGEVLEAERELPLPVGISEISFPIAIKARGRIEYRLELQPMDADRWSENNVAHVAAVVPGPPRVLVVDAEPALAAPLARVLRGRELDVDVRPPAAAPTTDQDLARYAFVILSDLGLRELRADSVAALTRYVERFGGGLLVAGGAAGFAPRGAAASGLDHLLPVRAFGGEQRDEASLALALIIDCSGSMAGGKLELAREAAALTARTLADADLIEVIGFSSQPERRVRLQPANNRASIAQSIERLAASGGTQLYPALDAAYRDLRAASARLKHAILLTDGQTQEAGVEDLASSMRADGITLSTVGLGAEVNRTLLESVAGLGGGRAYFPQEAKNVPQIFMSEASRYKRPSAVDRSTRIFVREAAAFLDGLAIQSAPALGGYVTTQPKPRPAQVILDTERGEPLLARWHVGLGYVLAWTSDFNARWSNAILRWPSFDRFLVQLVREHMRAPALHDVPLDVRFVRDQLRVIADVFGDGDQFEDGLVGELSVASELGEIARASFAQIAPGRYEAALPWAKRGAFTLQASFRKEGQLRATGHGRFAADAEAEFQASQPNAALLARVAARTGGRQLATAVEALRPSQRRVRSHEPHWPAFAWLALGLFMLAQSVRHARVFGKSVAPGRAGG